MEIWVVTQVVFIPGDIIIPVLNAAVDGTPDDRMKVVGHKAPLSTGCWSCKCSLRSVC